MQLAKVQPAIPKADPLRLQFHHTEQTGLGPSSIGILSGRCLGRLPDRGRYQVSVNIKFSEVLQQILGTYNESRNSNDFDAGKYEFTFTIST